MTPCFVCAGEKSEISTKYSLNFIPYLTTLTHMTEHQACCSRIMEHITKSCVTWGFSVGFQDFSKLTSVHRKLSAHRELGMCIIGCGSLGQKKKNVYVALSRPTVKCEKTGSGFFFFFFFFMSDLGEEFAKICIQWLKKALAWYAFWLHSARVFPI